MCANRENVLIIAAAIRQIILSTFVLEGFAGIKITATFRDAQQFSVSKFIRDANSSEEPSQRLTIPLSPSVVKPTNLSKEATKASHLNAPTLINSSNEI
jgi:hypothetical protein